MCLILFSYKHTPGYKFILGANRDEFLNRPTHPLDYFNEQKTILAGRDLRGGGTWFGISMDGKIAGITNYRDPALNIGSGLSRGKIIRDYLESEEPADIFLEKLTKNAKQYDGFNLLAGDKRELFFYSNAAGKIRRLTPGLYGLSNHLLDTAWPKVRRGKQKLKKALALPEKERQPAIFSLLQDTTPPSDEELPETGVGIEWERILSTIFITAPAYGTRSSAFLSINDAEEVTLVEKTFAHSDKSTLESGRKEFNFHLRGKV